MLWTEPIVRYYVEKRYKVNVLTNYPEAFHNYPSVNLTVNQPTTLSSFFQESINLDSAYEHRPRMHMLEAYRLAAEIPSLPLSYPVIYLTQGEKIRKVHEKYVVLHIEKNRLDFRNAYNIDWAIIVSYLTAMGFRVIQVSKKGTDIYGEWVKTDNFRDIMSLIYHSELFVGLDSGPGHIAASFGIPAVLFFGSVNPLYRHLGSFNGRFLQSFCEYAHCYHEIPGAGQVCRFEKPKCCVFHDKDLISAINDIMGFKAAPKLKIMK